MTKAKGPFPSPDGPTVNKPGEGRVVHVSPANMPMKPVPPKDYAKEDEVKPTTLPAKARRDEVKKVYPRTSPRLDHKDEGPYPPEWNTWNEMQKSDWRKANVAAQPGVPPTVR